MNGMQDYETMERWLGFKGSVDSLDTELAGLHEEEFWNWLICNYKRFVADCKSYDISSTLQMSNSGEFPATRSPGFLDENFFVKFVIS
jgi:hypothetical protein